MEKFSIDDAKKLTVVVDITSTSWYQAIVKRIQDLCSTQEQVCFLMHSDDGDDEDEDEPENGYWCGTNSVQAISAIEHLRKQGFDVAIRRYTRTGCMHSFIVSGWAKCQ